MLDFLKAGIKSKKKTTSSRPSRSLGTVRIGGHTFRVTAISAKGFILDPYDKDLVIQGQRFRFDMDAVVGNFRYSGRADAIVTRIADGALAAAFITKYFKPVPIEQNAG